MIQNPKNQEEMNQQSFSLQVFDPSSAPDLQITGSIARSGNILTISYMLQGDLTKIEIPVTADIPSRKNELWEETCFEFFLSMKNSSRYWEFNLSPSGDWNIYRFDEYRQGMREEMAITSLLFSVQHQSDILQLTLELDLSKIIPAQQSLDIAIATVVKDKNGEITYWALNHCGKQADFHLRDSFVVEVW